MLRNAVSHVRRIAAIAALSATLVVGVFVWVEWGRQPAAPGHRPELHALVAAMDAQPARPVEGRLSGGWAYAPLLTPTRGTAAPRVAPEVLIAAAHVQKVAASDDSPANRAALGVAHLVLGDSDSAVDAMQEAVQRHDSNASFHSDLSAALIARASSGANGEDWAAALDAAERAIKRDATMVEAYFNRALALEGLHLTDQAIDARLAYQRLETDARWLAESTDRLRALRQTIDAPAESRRTDHQLLRERIEDELLPAWARAVLGQQPETARQALKEATDIATRLADAGGDTMALDEVRLIASSTREVTRALAEGHALFGQARQEYVRDNQERAANLMTQAARHFAHGKSPYALWAPVYRSITLRNQGAAQRALDETAHVDIASLPASYHSLRGRVAWSSAVALAALGRFDLTAQRIKEAVAAYAAAAEVDNLIATRTILVEAEWFLGNAADAWSSLLRVLDDVEANGGSRRDFHLLRGAVMAQQAGLIEAALAFDNARVNLVSSVRSKTEAYLNRARTRLRSGDRSGASQDLDLAEQAASALSDQALRERNFADIRTARADVLSETNCHASLASANLALDYVPKADPTIRLADLLALRAKCRRQLGDVAGARSDLLAAIYAFEEKRSNLRSIQDRTQGFERERHVFKRLIEIEAESPGGSDRALAIAERARAGALLETWTRSEFDIKGFDPSAARHHLPRDTAIVYFELLAEKVLVWVITRERTSHFTAPLGEASLEQSVTQINRRIRDGASIQALVPYARELVGTLVRPALQAAGTAERIFFVPDGPLHRLSFGALPDETGRPLLLTHTIGVTPGIAAFIAASQHLNGFSPDEVLTVGDGHDPAATGLPVLRWADVEASRVGAEYPHRTILPKTSATKARLTRTDAGVLHFAGHAVANRHVPGLSRLLLAPDEGADTADWLASEIVEHRFRKTRIAVLSACDSAVGKFVAGEGNLSVGRAFFAAGVPSVVASLWPVDDDIVDLMVGFHRQLRSRSDAVAALRAAQLAFLESAGPDVPVRRWGGFVAYGGAASRGSMHIPELTE